MNEKLRPKPELEPGQIWLTDLTPLLEDFFKEQGKAETDVKGAVSTIFTCIQDVGETYIFHNKAVKKSYSIPFCVKHKDNRQHYIEPEAIDFLISKDVPDMPKGIGETNLKALKFALDRIRN